METADNRAEIQIQNGASFHVRDQGRFAKEVLPKYFKHNNMASFVRQLNMYGFRKVVNIEQGGLVKPDLDDNEFQHQSFLRGHEHLLEQIKRKVSVLRSEENRLRQEDLSRIICEVQVLRGQQDSAEGQLQDLRQQNEVLWREVMSLRQQHHQQHRVMNKLIHCLFSPIQAGPSSGASKRKLPLMLAEGTGMHSGVKVSRTSLPELPLGDSYFIQSPSTETSSCRSSSTREVREPIISDISDISPSPEDIMSPSCGTQREKSPMLLKEEPDSPRGKGTTAPSHVSSSDYGFYMTAPPVIPVAVVQSVLEGKGSCSPEQRSAQQPERRDQREPPERELGEPLESEDLSLENLQLLLRGQPVTLEPEGGLEVFSSELSGSGVSGSGVSGSGVSGSVLSGSGLSGSEWSLLDMDVGLSLMQQLPKDLEKPETELMSKEPNPPDSGKDPASPRTFAMEAHSSFGAPELGVPAVQPLYDPSHTLAQNETRTPYLSPGANPDP
ncbi:heat shock factor protein 4 isoform X1 [Monodelphis domestica]|uniref:heat shock factor protein 4 isoform X1 n=1 Tax=Monodelphis domestica TaxID=13616 RepID=UPI0024E1F3A9|nr:heat shock factor protein 4 isoform X1 [Monodelphis domestica]